MPNTVQRQPPIYVEPGQDTDIEMGGDGRAGQKRGAERESEKEGEQGRGRERERQRARRHPLLIPTLQQIVTSRFINLVFLPTLSHLRAYLSIFPNSFPARENAKEDEPPTRHFDKKGIRVPLLVVYGLVAMHRDTSEWSAQGVASSVAALVEAGMRGRRGVVVFEEREFDDALDGAEGEERERKTGWEERLPMLNGSAKRVGLESEDGGWSGRTVEVGRVLGRWFRFERGEWDE